MKTEMDGITGGINPHLDSPSKQVKIGSLLRLFQRSRGPHIMTCQQLPISVFLPISSIDIPSIVYESATVRKDVNNYVCMFRTSYRKSPPALILRFLRHSLIQKLFTNYSVSEKTRTDVDAIVCVATIAHSQWKSLVTWTDLSNNGHIDELVGESATSV